MRIESVNIVKQMNYGKELYGIYEREYVYGSNSTSIVMSERLLKGFYGSEKEAKSDLKYYNNLKCVNI